MELTIAARPPPTKLAHPPDSPSCCRLMDSFLSYDFENPRIPPVTINQEGLPSSSIHNPTFTSLALSLRESSEGSPSSGALSPLFYPGLLI